MNKSRIPFGQLMAYGLLALPLAFVGLPLYIYVPDLYATQQGISLSVMGMILMAIRLFDAVQDPLIGVWSDRFLRHRPLIMAVSFVVFAASFFLLYHPMGNSKIWMAVMMLLAMTAYSVLAINLNAIGSLWSEDPVQKTRIVSVREGLGVFGLLLAVMLLPFIRSVFPNGDAYHLYAIGTLVLSMLAAFVFFLWLRSHQGQAEHPQEKPAFKLRLLLGGYAGKFYLIYGLSALASSIPAVLVLFFIRDRLGAENQTGLFLCLYFVAAFIGMPFWKKCADWKTKRTTWLYAMILACFSFVWAFFLGKGDVVPYAIICLVSGFSFGAELILPPSILSDLIDKKSHQHETAAYFSVLAFLTKFSLAMASGVSLMLLGKAQFLPALQNSDQSLLVLNVAYAVLPCAIKLLAMMVLIYWIRKEYAYDSPSQTHP